MANKTKERILNYIQDKMDEFEDQYQGPLYDSRVSGAIEALSDVWMFVNSLRDYEIHSNGGCKWYESNGMHLWDLSFDEGAASVREADKLTNVR